MKIDELTVDGEHFSPGQQRYWRSSDRFVLLSGGFGSGKTTALSLKILQLLIVNWGKPGLVIAPNWRTMWAVVYRRLMNTLRLFLKPHELPRLRDRTGECYLDFGPGSAPVYLRSAHNYDGYDGLDVAWIAGDEARYWSRMAWSVAQGRARVPCPLPQIALASTPEMGWLSDEFDSGRPDRRLIIAPTRENERNLAPGYIEGLKLSYSPRLWRALVEGLFTILEGAVYESLDTSPQSPWIADLDVTPTSTYFYSRPCFLAVDPGYRRSSWIWIVEDDDLNWIVFDSLMGRGMSDAACVREVNLRNWPIDEVWCDPAAGATQSFEGASTIKLLGSIKTRRPRPVRTIAAANREIAWGVDKVRTLLGDPDSGQEIRLRFARSLLERERGKERGVIKDLASYRYPEAKDGKALSEVPLKDGVTDHSNDAVRYWAVGRWTADPKLRRLDPVLSQRAEPGWRHAG